MKRGWIICGIGTDVGKTVVSAIVVKLLRGEYWKPVSCGPFEVRDSHTVETLVNDPTVRIHREAYHFRTPASPHYASLQENPPVQIETGKISLPDWQNDLVVEGVGGVMVPLNDHQLASDLFLQWEFDWIVVSRNYLGSINHTLLTLDYLRTKGAKVAGLVFNGQENRASESFILNYAGIPMIGRVREEGEINSKTIEGYRDKWAEMVYWKQKINQLQLVS